MFLTRDLSMANTFGSKFYSSFIFVTSFIFQQLCAPCYTPKVYTSNCSQYLQQDDSQAQKQALSQLHFVHTMILATSEEALSFCAFQHPSDGLLRLQSVMNLITDETTYFGNVKYLFPPYDGIIGVDLAFPGNLYFQLQEFKVNPKACRLQTGQSYRNKISIIVIPKRATKSSDILF